MRPKESPDRKFIYYRKRGGLWRLPVVAARRVRCSRVSTSVILRFRWRTACFFVAAGVAEADKERFDSKICFYDDITRQIRDVVIIPGPLGWGLSVSADRRKFLVTRLKTGDSDLRFISHL